MKNLLGVYETFKDIDNPAIQIALAFLIAFSLAFGGLIAIRRLVTSEYVTAGKEAFGEYHKMYKALERENIKLRKEIEKLKIEIKNLKRLHKTNSLKDN